MVKRTSQSRLREENRVGSHKESFSEIQFHDFLAKGLFHVCCCVHPDHPLTYAYKDPLAMQLPLAFAMEPSLLPLAISNGFHLDSRASVISLYEN